MIRTRRLALGAAVAAVVVGLATGGALGSVGARSGRLVPAAGADETTVTTAGPPSTDPTSTGPDPTGSTTTLPGSTPTDAAPGPDQSTTTTAPGTLPAGDGAEDDVGSAFGPQAPFNPASKQPQPAAIARAQHDQDAADAALVAAQGNLDRARQAIADEQDSLAGLAGSQRRLLAAAEQAQSLLVERAVTLYMAGGGSSSVDLLGRANPSDIEIGMEMLDEVLDQLGARARGFLASRDALGSSLQGRLNQGSQLEDQLTAAQGDVTTATAVDQAAHWQLTTYQDGSHVWVPGFIFPVLGPTRFVDSFGDARLSGTSEQHWHEGCDVMAAAGTPMVAVEDGVLTRYGGGDPLGGNSLTLTGVSGYWYYYAHLSAFVPDLKQGDLVKAGQVIGYVGATGDAAAPHLHFEVHNPGGQVLDSYGMLKAAWTARQTALGLGGDDPANPPDPTAHPDPGTPAGFPRDAVGNPVPATPGQPLPPPPPY